MTRERCGGPGRRRKEGLVAISLLLFVSSLAFTHAKQQSIQDTLSADDTVFFEQAVSVHEHLSCPAPPTDMLPVSQQGALSCCGGKTCPYLNGVCCANGQHCCPAGTICLPPTPFSIRTGIQACAATASMLNPAARACVCESATPCTSWPCDAPPCKCAMQRKCYPGKPCAPKWITSRPQTPLPVYTPPPVVENTTVPLNIDLNPPRAPVPAPAPIIADNNTQSGLSDEEPEANATALSKFGNGLIRVFLPVENVNYTAYLEHPLLFHTKLVKDLALAFGVDRDLIDVTEVHPIGRQPPNDNVTYVLERQAQYKKALKAAKAADKAEDSEDSEESGLSSDTIPYTGESPKPPALEPEQMWNDDDRILGVLCVVSVMPPHEKWNSLLHARTIFQQLQANGTVNITNVNNLDDEWIRWNNTMEFEINMSRLDIMVSFDGKYINDNAARRVIAKILKESESTSSQIATLKDVLNKVRQQIESFKVAEKKQRAADQEQLFKAKDIESRNAKAAEQLEARAKQHRDYIANENSVKSEQRAKETAAQDKIRGEQSAKEQDKKRAIVEAAKAVKAEEESNKKQEEELFNERMASERSEVEKANKAKTQAEIDRQKAAAAQMAKFEADQAKLVAAAKAVAEKAHQDAVAQANAQAKLTESEDILRAQQQEQMEQQKQEEEKAQQEEDEKRVEEEGEKKEAAKEQATVASQAFAEAAKQMRLANADRLAAKMKEASLLGVAQTKAASLAASMQMEYTKATAAYTQVLASAKTAEAKLKAANAEIEKAGSAAEQKSLQERKAIDAQLERQVALAKQQAATVKAAAQKRIQDMQVQYKQNAAKQKAAAKADKKALKTQLKAKRKAAQKQIKNDILTRAKKEADRLVKTAQLAVTEGASFGLNQFRRHSIRGPVCNPIAPILKSKPGLIARWGFDGDLRDSIGSLHGIPVGGAAVYRHGGVRFRKGFTVRTEKITQPISTKTLEVFVKLGKKGMKQRKAGVMTLTNADGTAYDGISYGLYKKRRWAVNSEKRARSKRSKKAKKEKRARRDFVSIAVVYGQDGSIAMYRNGRLYQKAYKKGNLQSFAAQGGYITFGAGHGGSGKWLRGIITEARLYNRALTQVELEQSFKFFYECPKDCANIKWNDRGPFPADCVRGAFLHAGCDHTGKLISQVGSAKSWWQKQTWGTVLQDMNAYYQLDVVHGDGQRKGTCSARPNKLNTFQKVYVSWMSFNFPNHYIVAARNGIVMLLPTASPNFGAVLASYRMVPALGNPRKGFVSFESLERPGYYLRQVATPIIERRVGFLEVASFTERPRGHRYTPPPRPSAPAPRPQPQPQGVVKRGGPAPGPRPSANPAPIQGHYKGGRGHWWAGQAGNNGGQTARNGQPYTGGVARNGPYNGGQAGSRGQNGSGVSRSTRGFSGSAGNSARTGPNGSRVTVGVNGSRATSGPNGGIVARNHGGAANGKASGALGANARKPNPPPRPPGASRGGFFNRRGRGSRNNPFNRDSKTGGRRRGRGRRGRGHRRGGKKKNRRGKKKGRKGKKKSKKNKKRKTRGRKRAAQKEQNVNVDIKLQASDGSAAFAEDASFKLVKGLAAESNKNVTYISFESMMRAGWFMRHQNYQFKMHKFENTDLFKKDATFIPKQSLVGQKNDKEAETRLKALKLAQRSAEELLKKSKVEADEAVRREVETARVEADKEVRSEAKVKRRVKRMNKAAEKRQEKQLAKAANKEIKALSKKLKAQAKQKRAQEEKGKKAVTSTLFKKLSGVQVAFDQAKEVATKARKRALAVKKKFAKMQLKARRLAKMARKAKELIARERRRQRIRQPLRTTKFFYPYGSGYAVPQVGLVGKWKKRKALCMLGGLVKGYTVNTTEVFAKVPGVCRPSSRLIFDGHGEKGNTMRIDLFQNGSLARQAGSVKGSYFSLDGFVYPMRNASLKALPLEEPWVNLEHSYQTASWMKVGDFCFLSGVIRTNDFRTSSWLNTIAYLPKKCRPKGGKLLFSVNHHEKTHRIDVSPNGRVEWVSGNKTHAFISLSGIGFMTRSVHRIRLNKGLAAYKKGFRRPSYHKQGHVCALSGVLAIRKKPAPQNLFRLPRECRPAAHHTYAVNQQRYSLRINVLRNGYVKFVYPAPLSYIPLDGIRFLTDSAKPEKLYRLEMKPLKMRALSALTGVAFAYNDISRLVGSKPFVSTNSALASKLNDGRYGDDSAWRAAPKPASGKIFAGIRFGRTELIRAISFGRDNTGRLTDKSLDTYTVQYTQVRRPSKKTPESKWRTIGNITYTATPQLPPPAYVNDKNKARVGVPEPSKHHLFEFSKRVAATAVRILVTQPTTTIDEIEVYKQRFTETAMVPALVGGNPSPANLASAGVTVFGSSAAPGFPMRAVVDGVFGQDYAWAPNASLPLRSRHFIGLRWDKPIVARSIAWGRDNTDIKSDRVPAKYILQYTLAAATEKTSDAVWRTIGVLPYSAWKVPFPHRRHVFNFNHALKLRAVRILVEGTSVIDEIEVYGDRFPVIKPLKAFFGGSFEKKNLARTDNARAMVSSSYPLAQHKGEHINDGVYGNANSWMPDKNFPIHNKHFGGIQFENGEWVQSIAWGRDNTDTNKDRCLGSYTLQYSPVMADEYSDDKVWITLGSVTLDGVTMPQAHRRHVFNLSRKVFMMAFRIVLSDPDNAIDEIELYDRKLSV